MGEKERRRNERLLVDLASSGAYAYLYCSSSAFHHEFVHSLKNYVTRKPQRGRFPVSADVRSTPNSLPSLNYPH